MPYFIALLLLIAPSAASTQNGGQSVSQSNKPGKARQNARHKKKVRPPAAPNPIEGEIDKPTAPPAAPNPTEGEMGKPTVPPAAPNPTEGEMGKPTAPPAAPNPTEGEMGKPAAPPAASNPTEGEMGKPTLQYNQTSPEDTSKPATKQAHDAIDRLNALSTAVVGAFTVVLAIVTYRQYRATRTAERAWIVQLPPAPPTRNSNGDYEIRWDIENRGHTPAWVTSLGSAGSIVQVGQNLPDNPQYTMTGPFPPEGTVLSPEGKILRGLTIPFDDMTPVEQGQRILYVFGIVEYRDIFKGKHETRYCYRFKVGPSAIDPSPRDFYVEGPSSYIRAT